MEEGLRTLELPGCVLTGWSRTDLLLWYLFYREIRVIDIEWHVKKCHISIEECWCLKAGRVLPESLIDVPYLFLCKKTCQAEMGVQWTAVA